ncbi:MAG TPA: M20 family peptidase, partial [Steroidobacteraceae bacterium]|nr:M20 family peptidase [Steroidobacteraceae bacterium]
MSPLRRIGLALLAVLVLVAAIIAVRTASYRSPQAANGATPALAPAVPIDLDRAATHLAEAIRIRTVSHQSAAENEWAEWDRLHAWLETTYPAAHAAMTRETVAEHALLYTWPGSDPASPPVVLMAHQDVVPVTPGTESDWRHPPFEGAIAEGAVWGRGSVDDKGSLVSLFEALDALARSGFHPRRTIIVVSGHDEEAGGTGAHAAAQLLQSRGVHAQFTLDEGLVVVADFPLLKRPTALIGIAEKGYATLRVTAPAKGGHSSAPPRETGVEVLAKAVLAITGHPFPLRFDGPAAAMVRALAPEASPMVRMAVANEWLFGPLLVRQMASTAVGASSLHTTIAPTMLRGSPKENVLPQDAAAWINYRIAPGNTTQEVLERARAATAGLAVDLAWEGQAYDPSPVSSADSEGYRVIAALAS